VSNGLEHSKNPIKSMNKMENQELTILVTNDDGIDAPGILALVLAMKKLGKVIVAAPDRQQSAVGHALTVSKPLRITKYKGFGKEVEGYAINGTPSDCVKLAISAILGKKPDLVISGINHGQNTSVNILYSGTVSAATEGMLLGVPSIAVSLSAFEYSADCSVAAEFALEISKKLLENKLPKGTFLNVNVPYLTKEEIKGIKITRHSNSHWDDFYEKRTDPFGRDYYWFSGKYKTEDEELDSDDVAIKNGYVSITPIHYDFTDYNALEKLKKEFIIKI